MKTLPKGLAAKFTKHYNTRGFLDLMQATGVSVAVMRKVVAGKPLRSDSYNRMIEWHNNGCK